MRSFEEAAEVGYATGKKYIYWNRKTRVFFPAKRFGLDRKDPTLSYEGTSGL